ncbi:ribulose 1,5-bisphosphate carboxylase large subunit-like protein [Phyllobacterium ifriqiyense]|uniref:Ribulose 1,5-bisphosphate carboxylase large subunit-like protein n=1 Tax=Phyllobacterium ifriqiyense TaxID=314238 RepID=A0ABU0S3Y8_9HYPH|nr:3-oxo-isoapionate-4-phosphate decarboxylase OiaX [Phyllobacterium ifriqiyense]MDQ0995476.1 ribulose 1,5-bisphosphate carboxylase large subunit-like protein [Phyllobacterium ifriqiyense]
MMIHLTYRIETPGNIEAMAQKIASDQSTGTFVPVPGETEELKARVAAHVVSIKPLENAVIPTWPELEKGHARLRRADVEIAFPLDAVGTDLSALMTIAIGGVYSIKGMTGIRVVDMRLPDAFRSAHPGPQFGIAGSRRLSNVYSRPIIGTIVKPALGLRPGETAALVEELVRSGVDFIKDDEKLMSPSYSPLRERVAAIMPLILDHEQRTGKKVMYAFGISHADPDELMRNHDLVLKAGGNCAVVNINSIGMGGMTFLRKRSGLVLHAHRNGWDLLTRSPGAGMDFKVWQQFWRLIGVDQFQINGIRVKYWEPDESFISSFKALSTPLFDKSDCPLPVAGSGQWGGQAPDTYNRTGRSTDLLYLCGGGIVSHPQGPAAGVRAVQQAWEAAVADIPLGLYAKNHPELAASINKFANGKGA